MSTSENSIMAESPSVEDIVPVNRKLLRRFYEVVILLVCLNNACEPQRHHRMEQRPPNLNNTEDETMLGIFVSKLALVCDTRPRGPTVTAFCVLQEADGVSYVFASNQRQPSELEDTRAWVCELLTKVRHAGETELLDEHGPGQERRGLLDYILLNNRARVELYLEGLERELKKCLNRCEPAESGPVRDLRGELLRLTSLVLDCSTAYTEEHGHSSEEVSRLIDAIETLQESRMARLIRSRTRGGGMITASTECWKELQHYCGRLLSYKDAVEVLLATYEAFPELFARFDVVPVPSSQPFANPLRMNPCTTAEIVGRITSGAAKLDHYQREAATLRPFGLDDLVAAEWTRTSLAPAVHAELLVLGALERAGRARARDFFAGLAFIGTSKAPCRLCSLYFAQHPSGVRVRSGHGNVYAGWRMPDLLASLGPDARETHAELEQGILQALRREALRVLDDKTPGTSRHDSWTASSYRRARGGVDDTLSSRSLDPGSVAAALNNLTLQPAEA